MGVTMMMLWPVLAFLGIFLMPLLPPEGDLASLVDPEACLKRGGVEAAPASLLPLLEEGDAAGIDRWIADLGNDEFAVREKASAEIRRIGRPALPLLAKAKESKDPEVASRATTLVEEIETAGSSTVLKRVCAIRVLGRLKSKEALPALRRIAAGGDVLLRAHAERAIAAIEGKPAPPPAPAMTEAEFRDLLARLPASTNVVLAVPFRRGTGELGLLESAAKWFGLDAGPVPAFGGGDVMKKWEGLVKEGFPRAIETCLAEIGNARPDGLVLGLSLGEDGEPDWGAVLARGVFDRARVESCLRRHLDVTPGPGEKPSMFEWKARGAPSAGVFSFLDDRTILLGVRMISAKAVPPFPEIAERKPGDPKGLLADKRWAERVARAPLGKGVWMAMDVLPHMRKSFPRPEDDAVAAALEGFSLLEISVTDDAGLRIRISGEFSEEKLAKAMADFLREGLAKARKEEQMRMMEGMPGWDALKKLLDGLEFGAEGKRATLALPGESLGRLCVSILGLIPMGLGLDADLVPDGLD